MKFLKFFLYNIRKKQNYLSKDYNVELRCEKIIQIKGCEKFENDQQNNQKNDCRSRSDLLDAWHQEKPYDLTQCGDAS